MGARGGCLAHRATAADVCRVLAQLVTCHLKSKLLTFPGGRFFTGDEAERARFAAFALFRRAAEAAAVRRVAIDLLAGQGEQRWW